MHTYTRIHTHTCIKREKGQREQYACVYFLLLWQPPHRHTRTHTHSNSLTHTHTAHTHTYSSTRIWIFTHTINSARKQTNWHCGAPYHANARHSPDGSCLPAYLPPSSCLPPPSLVCCLLFVAPNVAVCVCVLSTLKHVRLPVMLSSPPTACPCPYSSPTHQPVT